MHNESTAGADASVEVSKLYINTKLHVVAISIMMNIINFADPESQGNSNNYRSKVQV